MFYDLARQILGNVPIEFAFVYHFFAFGLGLLVVLTILSPFYFTYKILRVVY